MIWKNESIDISKLFACYSSSMAMLLDLVNLQHKLGHENENSNGRMWKFPLGSEIISKYV